MIVPQYSIPRQSAGLVLQVRRLTGALVAVGQGRLSVAQLRELLEARDTRAYPQGTVAPARGLFLTRVDYNQAGENNKNHHVIPLIFHSFVQVCLF